jgi:hypothetical protein
MMFHLTASYEKVEIMFSRRSVGLCLGFQGEGGTGVDITVTVLDREITAN